MTLFEKNHEQVLTYLETYASIIGSENNSKSLNENRLLFLAAFCFIVLFTSFDVHEVYISSLQMELKQQSGEIQLTLQLFTDDLETVLQSRIDSRIQLDPTINRSTLCLYFI